MSESARETRGGEGGGGARASRSAGAGSISSRLREACGDSSVAEVGERTGTHPETARRYLNGRSSPSIQFVLSVAEEFGVTCDWLLCGRGSPRVDRDHREILMADGVHALMERLFLRLDGLEGPVQDDRGGGSSPDGTDEDPMHRST